MTSKKLYATLLAGALTMSPGLNAFAEESVNGQKKQEQEENKDETSSEAPKKTSLLEATVYTSLPALAISSTIFAYQIKRQDMSANDVVNNLTWGLTHPPVFDKNPWYVNYVGHPIAGSESYMLARNRDHSMLSSFLYSTLISVTWEYALEPFQGARPSIQDLILTSTTGSIIGELRLMGKKKLMENKDNTLNKIGIAALDPIDAIYRLFE